MIFRVQTFNLSVMMEEISDFKSIVVTKLYTVLCLVSHLYLYMDDIEFFSFVVYK